MQSLGWCGWSQRIAGSSLGQGLWPASVALGWKKARSFLATPLCFVPGLHSDLQRAYGKEKRKKKMQRLPLLLLCLIILNKPLKVTECSTGTDFPFYASLILTATLKSRMFWKLVTATDVNTSLTLYILSENCTLKVHPKGMEILFHINQILTCEILVQILRTFSRAVTKRFPKIFS